MNKNAAALKAMIGKDPKAMFDMLYANNPAFKKFADSVKGKTPEEAFREHGLDFSDFKGMM